MTHLTLCGYYAGRPLCDCDKQAETAAGAEFIHAAYARLDRIPDVCPRCVAIWTEEMED